ncbi:MAG: PD40 domain-containing protein [Bacteroidia bacterium]|nr:PD40 domain-containing protein [Bacteroidia bacterium]
MAQLNKITVLCLFFALLSIKSSAQSRSVLEDEAYDYLNNGDFIKAYESFDKLHARYPKELDYQFKLGICCLSYPEKKERAIEVFQDMVTKYKTKEAEFYLARAYHANYKFDEALGVLKPLAATLMDSKKKEEKSMYDDVKIIISNCENGKIFFKNQLNSVVTNLGGPVNSKELEAAPVITADESMMIFTYQGKKSTGGKVNASLEPDPKGEYTSDIYMSIKVNDSTWGSPNPVTALNTKGNDAAIALSPDGLTLFTFLSTNENEGDIMVSRLQGSEFSTPIPLNSNVNTPEYWEGSCSISADGKFLYFSSERPTGLGGRDIYVSEWIDEDWGPAVNLGPKINTPLDDDAPFIHPDGVTLFFSSKGHMSIGDYDIMFATKTEDGWQDPKSMGMPVNTTEDDRFYVINSKGDKGYFSSDRATSDSRGGRDVYMVKPGVIGERLVVGLFKGTVFGDDKPIEARIDLVKYSNKENIGPFFSNKSTGKYLITLKPGSNYRIKIFADGYDPIEEDISMESLKDYAEIKKDFYMYSSQFAGEKKSDPTKLNFPPLGPGAAAVAVTAPKTEEPVKPEEPPVVEPAVAVVPAVVAAKEEEKAPEPPPVKTEPAVEPVVAKNTSKSPCGGNLPDMSLLKGKSLNDPANYQMLMNMAGSYCAENMVFKVQVGAYRNPANFKYSKLKALGKVVSDAYPDGITRFTLSQFKTIKEAEAMRQKAIGRGQADSWIVAFVDGKRYTLEDLILLDFLGKAIN